MKVKSESEGAQLCLTLCDPIDGSPPGSPVHGISRQKYWSGVPLPSPILMLKLHKGLFPPLFCFLFFWLHLMACGILVPCLGIEPSHSSVKAWISNHWTTREFPISDFLCKEYYCGFRIVCVG